MQREQVTASFHPTVLSTAQGLGLLHAFLIRVLLWSSLSSDQAPQKLRDKLSCTPIQTAHAHPLLAGACRVGIALHVQDAVVPHRLGSNGLQAAAAA